MGFTSHQPWYLACPFLAAHLSEVPIANWWIKCFLFILRNLLGPVCSAGPAAGPELFLRLSAYPPFLGLLKWELRCDVSSCPLPTGGGWGRAPPGPKQQSSAQPLPTTPVSLFLSRPSSSNPPESACAGRVLCWDSALETVV